MEGQIVATSPDHEDTDASPQSPKKPVNWGWIALGGCLGLLVILSPVIIPVLGMYVWASQEAQRIQAERETRQAEQATREARVRTPEASELVCYEVAPAVVARIEAGLTVPGGRLRGVRAVHSAKDPEEWFLAADVQGVGYEGERDIAVWRLTTRGDPSTGAGAPEAAIATKDGLADDEHALTNGNGLAVQVSNFPFGYGIDRPALQAAARACPISALAGG
jgi:hypothetical protein